MNSALESIRILDLSRLLPGAFCSMLLGDLGAEIIKIEHPEGGDPVRWSPPFFHKESSYFLAMNRNKKSVSLNFKNEEGKDIFFQLIKTADIILESFRPGVMERLGLGFGRLKEINPRLIYCAISGYGQNGPLQDRAGHDINYMGYSGILELIGEKERKPIIPSVQIADIGGGGLMAAVSILAALIARERTGVGQYIDVSMLDGLISWLVVAAAKYFGEGVPPMRGSGELFGGLACYQVYETKDGKYMTLGALEPKFWRNFCVALEREDLIERQLDLEDQESLKKEVIEIFKERTREDWTSFFKEADACCAPCLSMDETLNHPHIIERNMLTELNHPSEGKIQQLGFPFKLSGTPCRISLPPPTFKQHNEEILGELGYSKDEISEFVEDGVI